MSTSRRLVAGVLTRAGSALVSAGGLVRSTPERERLVAQWINDGGDESLRVEYPLDQSSVVLDLGGYAGQWASDIYSRYRAQIWILEPMPAYADNIRRRFKANPDIRVFSFGLGPADETILLSAADDETSAFKAGSQTIEAHIRSVDKFLAEERIDHVDLMKINIEGGEYDLLEHLIDTGKVEHIINLQIQFHDFVKDAEDRMHAIQSGLARTHRLTYQYRFVWENWARS